MMEHKSITILFEDSEWEAIKTIALKEGVTVHKIVQKAVNAYLWTITQSKSRINKDEWLSFLPSFISKIKS